MSKKRHCITDAAALPHTKLLLQFTSLSYRPTNHQLSGSHCILSVKTGLRKSAIPRQERDNKLNVKTLKHRGSYLEDDLRYSESWESQGLCLADHLPPSSQLEQQWQQPQLSQVVLSSVAYCVLPVVFGSSFYLHQTLAKDEICRQ